MGRLNFGDSRRALAALLGVLVAAAVVVGNGVLAHAEDRESTAPVPVDLDSMRARCRERTAHGGRWDAIAACDEAVKRGAAAEDMWAAAVARVSRPEAPTMDDLIRADLLANAAVRLSPGAPWGYVAHVEIARRWGDPELIARRLEELRKVAPADEETVRVTALLAPKTPWGTLIAWGALFFVCALTLSHAVARRLTAGPARRSQAPLTALIVAAFLLGAPGIARATTADPFPIDDADPVHSVPTPAQRDARPLDFAYFLQDLTDRADGATGRGDHAAAVRYYQAMAQAVPDSSVPFRKLCAAQGANGQRDASIGPCRHVLDFSDARADDVTHFAGLAIGDQGVFWRLAGADGSPRPRHLILAGGLAALLGAMFLALPKLARRPRARA